MEDFDSYVWREVSAAVVYQHIESLPRPLVAFLCFMCFAIGAVFVDLKPPERLTETHEVSGWAFFPNGYEDRDALLEASQGGGIEWLVTYDSVYYFRDGEWAEMPDTMWVEILYRWNSSFVNSGADSVIAWPFGDIRPLGEPRERCVYCEHTIPGWER